MTRIAFALAALLCLAASPVVAQSESGPAPALDALYQAATAGDAEAAHRLGLLYARGGEGVPQDDLLAYVWLARAAAAMPPGEARTVAIANRSTVAERLTPEQIARLEEMRRGPQTAATPVPAERPAAPSGWKGIPVAAAPDPAGGYRVQIGAFRSEEQARRALREAQRDHADLLKGLDLAIRAADRGDLGRFFRVQAGPLESAAADRLCDGLQARGAACLVVVR